MTTPCGGNNNSTWDVIIEKINIFTHYVDIFNWKVGHCSAPYQTRQAACQVQLMGDTSVFVQIPRAHHKQRPNVVGRLTDPKAMYVRSPINPSNARLVDNNNKKNKNKSPVTIYSVAGQQLLTLQVHYTSSAPPISATSTTHRRLWLPLHNYKPQRDTKGEGY